MLIREKETYAIIGAAMEVHKQLGCGFTEPVYQDALEVELRSRGIPFEREKHLTVTYKGIVLKRDYYADFVCFDDIIVELKSVKSLEDIHRAQILNYMKIQGWKIGLLMNFAELSLKYERIVDSKSTSRTKNPINP